MEKPSVAGPYVEAGAQRIGSEVFAVNQIDPVIDVEILVPVVDGHVGVAGYVGLLHPFLKREQCRHLFG